MSPKVYTPDALLLLVRTKDIRTVFRKETRVFLRDHLYSLPSDKAEGYYHYICGYGAVVKRFRDETYGEFDELLPGPVTISSEIFLVDMLVNSILTIEALHKSMEYRVSLQCLHVFIYTVEEFKEIFHRLEDIRLSADN